MAQNGRPATAQDTKEGDNAQLPKANFFMFDLTRQGWELIPPSSRKFASAYVPLSLAGGLLELTGIFSILPFILLATHPEVVQSNPYLSRIYTTLGFQNHQSFLVFAGLVLLAVVIVREFFGMWLAYYRTKMSATIRRELSEALLENYLSQSFNFFLMRHSAKLGQNVLVRVGRYMTGWFHPCVSLIGSSLSLSILAVGFFMLNPAVALSALLFFGGVQLLIYRRLKPFLINLGDKVKKLNDHRFRTAADAIQGIREAKILGCEPYYLDLYTNQNRELVQLQLSRVLYQQWPNLLSNVTLYGVVVSAILLLTTLASGSHLISLLTLYLLLVSRIVPKIQFIFHAMGNLRSAQSVVEELHRDLLTKPEEASANDVQNVIEPARESFALQDINFSYEGDRAPALEEINLRVSVGSSLAIVGATGAGKTTLLDILTGLLIPQSGEIRVDDQIINPKDWRKHVGYASQEIFLAAQPLAQNIAFGVRPEEIDLEAVERASKLACLHDFVTEELPDGYQTNTGERGAGLSKGQRQRVGIARALYHNPSVVFLDEATSGLDSATESQVLLNLTSTEPAKSVILVTHRLVTASRCENVAVLSKGRIAGYGPFEELSSSCSELLDLMTVARDPSIV